MTTLYQDDLAYIQERGFSDFAVRATPEIVALLRTLGIAHGTLIDVGCGAGESTRQFLEASFDVWAIEPSSSLLNRARRVAARARFLEGSVYSATLPSADAIVALGEPLTYHRREVDADNILRSFLGSAARALRRGGVLVFDIIVTGEPTLNARGWRSGEDWAVLFHVTEDETDQWLRRDIETFRRLGDGYRRCREQHDVRVFCPETVQQWLVQSGFSVTTCSAYGTCELAPRRLAFVARRT